MDSVAPVVVPVRSVYQTYFRPSTWPFWAFHIISIVGIIGWGWSWSGFALAVGMYYGRMLILTASYHRYFSHRTFKTSRVFQFILALLAQTSAQKGVIWWAAHHRWHHKHSDLPQDVHSAKLRGFWYSHIGWILGPDWDKTDTARVADLVKFPELRFLNHPAIRLLPAVALALILAAVGGMHALFWGFFVSTTVLWHGTFTINSLSHVFGRKVYDSGDESKNNWLLALVTCGEGWHNNHHHFQSSVNQGFHWYEIDLTYYMLRLFAACGLVWDLRKPPREVVEGTIQAAERAAAAARVAA